MTNWILQENGTKQPRLLVAIEMSLKAWRLAMAVEGQARKRVKTVEAGREGFHPYRRLTELGHEVWMIDSASIEVSRQRRRAKSDGIDADRLVELMQRQARGEQQALRIVRVPGVEAEDQRWLPREREGLLHDTQQVRNRIESVLFTQGYRAVPKSAKELKVWLTEPREMWVCSYGSV